MSNFEIKNGKLVRYRGNEEVVVIPEGVTSIGRRAFFNSDIKGVTIPDSVKTICAEAFACCHLLEEISIPACVRSIGPRAFARCVGLSSVTISDGVRSIGAEAFGRCMFLAEFNAPDNVRFGKIRIGKSAFWGCEFLSSDEWVDQNGFCIISGTLYQYRGAEKLPDDFFDNMVDPSEKINAYANWRVKFLSNAVIPDGVERIDRYAFSGISELIKVTIPASVVFIEDDAFRDCKDVTIFGSAGSYAEHYAKKNDIQFEAI